MKRLMCMLAVLGTTLWLCSTAQAMFEGTLYRNQGWLLHVDCGTVTGQATGITIHYVRSSKLDLIVVRTVAPGERAEFSFPAPFPNDVRIIIEVDPPPGAEAALEVVQGDTAPQWTSAGDTRGMFDVADAPD